MKWSNRFGFARHQRAGLVALLLSITSGCGPSGERTDNQSRPASTDRRLSRSNTGRRERSSIPTNAEANLALPNTVQTISSSAQSIPSVDLESAKAKANSGDSVAQTTLANYYATGQGGRIDLTEAVRWYRAAAERGEVRAQYQLGNLYAEGRGVTRDDREAVQWFYQAAQQGDRMAQYSMGLMYANGQGVAADN